MNKICDNVSNCHELTTIAETGEAMRVFCNICQRQFIIKKDWRGVPENKYYSKIFRKLKRTPQGEIKTWHIITQGRTA